MHGSSVRSLHTDNGAGIAPALDRTGVIASIGCAIHCMVAPVLLLVAPTLGGWWVHPATHLIIAALVVPVAALALWRGFGVHRRRWIITLGTFGILLVLIGVFLPWVAPSASGAHCCCPSMQRDAATGTMALSIPPASIVTILGGIALITAHVGNLRCACGQCRSKPPRR